MRKLRLLTTLPLLAIAALSFAGGPVAVGKLGQATEPTAVYSSPNTHVRMLYRLNAYDYLIYKHSDDPNWDRVLLKNGHYAYTPSYVVAELPYTYYRRSRRSSLDVPAQRDGSATSRGSANNMLRYALQFQGTPYVWGGDDLVSGVDCSGFVKKIRGRDRPGSTPYRR